MAQRQCLSFARRVAFQSERGWTEWSGPTRRIPQSLQTEQRRDFSRSYRAAWRIQTRFSRRQLPQHGLAGRTSNIRPFSTTPSRSHGDLTPPKPGEERHVTFIDKDGSTHTFAVADGDNLLDIAQANDLEMEGACGGSCACSTCHVIVTDGTGNLEGQSGDDVFDKMDEPSDDENDMLDLAFGLTETSRLGCQVVMSKELDGLVVSTSTAARGWSCGLLGYVC